MHMRRVLKRWFQREQMERELDSELRAYLDATTEEKVATGMEPDAARREALVELGGREQVKEAVREVRGGFALEQAWRDLRYALRGLRRSPGYTTVAILTLALGIGASTAIFSVVDTVLFRPLPYFEPQRLVTIYEGTEGRTVLAWAELSAYEQHGRKVEAIAGIQPMDVTVLGGAQPEQVTGAFVSVSLFPLLRVQPMVGRLFSNEEGRAGAEQVALISESLWRRRFDADPSIAGNTALFEVNEMWGAPANRQQAFVIVGVLPSAFETLLPGTEGDVWFPLVPSTSENHDLFVVARMKAAVTPAQIAQEWEAITEPMRKTVHSDARPMQVQVLPLLEDLLGDWKRALLVLLGAVGFVVLIACVNLANLLAVRVQARSREMAIRTALGAARGRLVRQTLTESVTLAGIGGALSLLVAYWGIQLLASASPANVARMDQVRLDGRVMVFAAAFTFLAAVSSGLLAALRVGKGPIAEGLQLGVRGPSLGRAGGRLRSAFVVAQVALALVLLIGSALMARTLAGLLRVETGFDPRAVLTMGISLPRHKYSSAAVRRPFYESLFQKLRALPGVQAVAVDHSMPYSGASTGARVRRQANGEAVDARWHMVSADFFRVLKIPVLRGRAFEPSDMHGKSPMAIVNQSLAEKLWGAEDPVGQRIHLTGNPPFTVVGVVGNIRDRGLIGEGTPNVYFSVFPRSAGLMIRSTAGAATLTPPIRTVLAELDAGLAPSDIRTMEDRIAGGVAVQRYTAILLSLFSATALFLGIVGLYGVMSYGVSQRTNEIGVRIALGAAPGDVMRMVLRHGGALVAAGTVIGLLGAAGLTRFLSALLFGVQATDVATFTIAAAALVAVGMLACYVPARRAAKVDPVVALRGE
jgi:putative ABC transport system permease protein